MLCKVVRGIQVVVEVASALQCCNTVQQAMTAATTTAIMGEKIERATINWFFHSAEDLIRLHYTASQQAGKYSHQCCGSGTNGLVQWMSFSGRTIPDTASDNTLVQTYSLTRPKC